MLKEVVVGLIAIVLFWIAFGFIVGIVFKLLLIAILFFVAYLVGKHLTKKFKGGKYHESFETLE